MADFDQVQSIQTAASETDLKGVLQLKIAGTTEPLTITAPSLSAVEDMADLIDGYCKLVNSGKESCWNRKGESQGGSLKFHKGAGWSRSWEGLP